MKKQLFDELGCDLIFGSQPAKNADLHSVIPGHQALGQDAKLVVR